MGVTRNTFSEKGEIMNVKSHIETIICPDCGLTQEAVVEHTVPFWTFVHKCDNCGYVICESEWEEHKCPHCGSSPLETWFDRTIMFDSEGYPVEYEGMCYRCNNCGKNISAPVEYYEIQSIPQSNCKELLAKAELILKALNISVQWELCSEVKKSIADILPKIRKEMEQ